MFNKIKYTTFEYKFGGSFSSIDDYSYVRLPYENNGGRKILFVLDYMPSEDLHEGRLLSGETGMLLESLLKATFSVELKKQVNFSWLACTFNAFKTAGSTREVQFSARAAFGARVRALVLKYKPDVIITFGHTASSVFLGPQLELSDKKHSYWYGVPVQTKVGSHECIAVSTLSLESLLEGTAATAGLLGYVIRNLANAITSTHRFAVDNELLKNSRTVLIDSVSKFNKLFDHLASAKYVAVDTEADNLNKIANRLLTIQFAVKESIGYVVPLYHKDTPFTPKELIYLKNRLRNFFEGENDNEYHIYANAGFDLNLMRHQLKTRYMHNHVHDIFGGEFGLDENYKFLSALTGEYYYSLANISAQYGFTGYMESKFSKKDRKNISTTDLDEDLLRYMSYDVVTLVGIHLKQLERAAHYGHAKYKSFVQDQINDTIHMFSRMESNGSGLDVSYLFYLRTPKSPIEETIKKMEGKLLDTPEVKKANQILLKKKGVPSNGLFGAANVNLFSLRKDEHKQILFFDVLKLKPLSRGVSINGEQGKGKLDKAFQKEYASHPIVAAYTGLGQANKLKNAYVKSFIKLLASDEDIKVGVPRIRPRYNYLLVITGRTSASDPNLQQIPSHSELGKQIKRLFVARAGRLYLKVDYKVHEVRGWGIISFDVALAKIFKDARKLRNEYRLHPTPELAMRLKLEADVHVVNASYFFSVLLEKVDKVLRNAVKAVIFGLIYQMSIKSLAKTIDKPLEYANNLVNNFRKKFPSGMKWIEDAKIFARKHLYYENPLGMRRHLWGYLYNKASSCGNKVHAEMDRRAVNSPIQGMGAQFMSIGARYLDTMIFKLWKEQKRDVDYAVCNSVHDSLENEFAYRDFLLGIKYVEYALIDGVRKTMVERHGFKLVVDVDIDAEIGPALSHSQAWDDSLVELERIVYESLVFQRDELHHDIVVSSAMKEVFVDGWPDAPDWMVKQAANTKWSFDMKKYLQLERKTKSKAA